MAEEVEDLEDGELASSDEEELNDSIKKGHESCIETDQERHHGNSTGTPDATTKALTPPWNEWSGKERKRPFSPGTPSPQNSNTPNEVKVGNIQIIHTFTFYFANKHNTILLVFLASLNLLLSLLSLVSPIQSSLSLSLSLSLPPLSLSLPPLSLSPLTIIITRTVSQFFCATN